MAEVEADQLKQAVEQMHGSSATLAQSVPVRETFEGAYAWSSPIEGSTRRRFFAVLHQPPVDTPQAAVRAAIIAEHRMDR